MASQGPNFPSTGATLANAGTSENAEAWVTPGNVVSDNGTETTITASTYDSPDISQLLVASNFGFTIPAGATIDGIIVEIDRRNSAGAASDNRVQLATGTTFATLVGNNKAAAATDWPTTTAVASYGASNDTWASGLTAAQINASGFAVFLSVQADAANTDIQVDYIRVTVHYTDPSVTVTPTTVALTITRFAPTVSVTDHKLVTPTTVALALSAFAPTVTASDHKLVTPTTVALILAGFAPTVTVGVRVVPTTVALVLSPFAPTVTATDHKLLVPGTRALVITTFAPSVQVPMLVIPAAASLVLSPFAPVVTASDHQIVMPGVVALVLTPFAPEVVVLQSGTIVPGTLALVLTTYPPTVTYLQRASYSRRHVKFLGPRGDMTDEELYELIFGTTPPLSYREF